MNVSSSVSVINLHGYASSRVTTDRYFVWPVYGEGKVEKIHGITRRTDGNAVYSKPIPEDHYRLMGLAGSAGEMQYDRSGRVQARSSIPEHGSFFDAIV